MVMFIECTLKTWEHSSSEPHVRTSQPLQFAYNMMERGGFAKVQIIDETTGEVMFERGSN